MPQWVVSPLDRRSSGQPALEGQYRLAHLGEPLVPLVHAHDAAPRAGDVIETGPRSPRGGPLSAVSW